MRFSPSHAPARSSAEYNTMIGNSLVAVGNNFRLKQAITKAKGGGNVNIAYIGGSITEGYKASSVGNCYASLSAASFKSLFGGQVTTINAGMAGTPSTLGIIRYKRDVLDRLLRRPRPRISSSLNSRSTIRASPRAARLTRAWSATS